MHKCELFWSAWSFISFVRLATSIVQAQSAASVATQMRSAIEHGKLRDWWNTQLPEEIQRDVLSKGQRLADPLHLNDEQKSKKASALITEHYARVWAWHQQVDAKLNAAWAAWSDKQIVKMFKMQTFCNELSIDHFGYDYQKRYRKWVA